MRPLLRLPFEIATAVFFSASVGIAAGVVAVSFTHRLEDGLSFGLPAMLLAAATFGYFIWKAYCPGSERVLSSAHAPARETA